jgi:eukaryotic-like serine/threonine-protein kinase
MHGALRALSRKRQVQGKRSVPTMTESIGSFQILGELGKGAHSTIYHIRRHSDSRQFALKVVPINDRDDLKFQEQAQHEFRVAQMLDHANLVKI